MEGGQGRQGKRRVGGSSLSKSPKFPPKMINKDPAPLRGKNQAFLGPSCVHPQVATVHSPCGWALQRSFSLSFFFSLQKLRSSLCGHKVPWVLGGEVGGVHTEHPQGLNGWELSLQPVVPAASHPPPKKKTFTPHTTPHPQASSSAAAAEPSQAREGKKQLFPTAGGRRRRAPQVRPWPIAGVRPASLPSGVPTPGPRKGERGRRRAGCVAASSTTRLPSSHRARS